MSCRFWNPPGASLAEVFRALCPEERRQRLEALTRREALNLRYEWSFWARPKQTPPPLLDPAVPGCAPWRYWLLYAGRMFGKTRTAAEWLRGRIERGEVKRIVLAAPRYVDVERVMIGALMQVFPADRRPKYNRDKFQLTFWPYGPDAATADVCSGMIPDSFRGPEWDCGWLDEFAAFVKLEQVWERLIPAMRAIPPGGGPPQLICTTTPRNRKTLHDLLEDPTAVLTQGSSAENQHNVASGVLDAVRFVYQGSDLALQELEGKLLGNEPGAMFKQEWFTANRVVAPPKFKKKIVVIDTSGSGRSNACECGIMLLGLAENGQTAYQLGDYSLRAAPDEWAARAYQVYREHAADEIVYESQYGGDLVPTVFKLLKLPAKFVRRPGLGTKAERAQPVRALVQQGRVKFCGVFKDLELQCCTWTPEDTERSPDRMDAFVHGVTHLFPVIEVARGAIQVPGIF